MKEAERDAHEGGPAIGWIGHCLPEADLDLVIFEVLLSVDALCEDLLVEVIAVCWIDLRDQLHSACFVTSLDQEVERVFSEDRESQKQGEKSDWNWDEEDGLPEGGGCKFCLRFRHADVEQQAHHDADVDEYVC